MAFIAFKDRILIIEYKLKIKVIDKTAKAYPKNILKLIEALIVGSKPYF